MPPADPRHRHPSADEETDRMEAGASGGGRPASNPEFPAADLLGLLREILRGQRRIDSELTEIKERLAAGSATLDNVAAMEARERAQRDEIVEIRTKVSGVLWVAGVAATVAIGAIVTAIFSLILRPGAH